MQTKLNKIYNKLYAHFGPQHWWPAKTRFEVMVGAILTQNTNWGNVEKALVNLKKNRLLTPAKLSIISHKRLAQLIRPAGYFNIKAKRLKNFLDYLISYYKGDLKKMAKIELHKLRQELLSVNGIGLETADSILLYSLDKPIFVVDAYTKRVFSRHGIVKEDAKYEAVQNLFMRGLEKKAVLFNEYHALIVKLAKEFCLKSKSRCADCPLGEKNDDK